MSDQPFYAPNHKPTPRQPRTGEHLWTVEKNGRQVACELRDDGNAGVEFQVYRDGELLYGRRWANRALAQAEADEREAKYLREGGVLIVIGDPRSLLRLAAGHGMPGLGRSMFQRHSHRPQR